MPTNVEIKARVREPEILKRRAETLCQSVGQMLIQEDTFFSIPNGRLKLRVTPERSELIYYERDDTPGPKSSHYLLAPIDDPQALRAVLGAALGVRGTVRKRRWLFLVGQTRLHLDEVEELGSFVELEVVLQPQQTSEEGRAIAAALMADLGITSHDLIEGAYIDLLEANESGRKGET